MLRKESSDGTAENGNNDGGGEIMLFGVRVKVDPMRKSVSMNNLSQYEQPNGNNTNNTTNEVAVVAEDTGYASADDAVPHQSTGGRERKRGVPWTEEEHKLFLLGLQEVGKGDWRGISRNFVKTRTPTQVASHAQKYFLRKNNINRRRRRSSLFDITTDSVTSMAMEESKPHLENSNQQLLLPTAPPVAETAPVTSNVSAYPVARFPVTVGPLLLPMQVQNPMEILTLGKVNQVDNASTMLLRPVPVVPISFSSAMMDPNLNQSLAVEPTQLSLGLSLSLNPSQSSTKHATFQVMPRFGNGDGIITVA